MVTNALGKYAAPLWALIALYSFVLLYVFRFSFLQHNRGEGSLWWADSHQALLRAFYVANGFSLYQDVPTNHNPGLITAISLWFRLLGFSGSSPGVEMLAAAERAGMAASGILQITVWWLAARAVGISLGSATVIAVCLLVFFWEAFGHYLPLAETWGLPVVALATALFAQISFGPLSQAASAYFLMLLTLIFLCLLTLAVVPLAAVYALMASVVLGARVLGCSGEAAWRRVNLSVPAVAVCVLTFSAYALYSGTLKGMWFWAVTFNQEVQGKPIMANIITHLSAIPSAFIDFSQLREPGGVSFPFLAYPPFFIALILFATLAGARYLVQGEDASRELRLPSTHLLCGSLFFTTLVAAYAAAGWRFPGTFVALKNLYAVGIAMGTLLFAFSVAEFVRTAKQNRPSAVSSRREVYKATAGLTGLTVILVLYLISLQPPAKVTTRPDAFNTTNVCRLHSASPGCLCILQAFFDPRRFLQYDVLPCRGYAPEHFHAIQASRVTREAFASAARSPDHVAFLVGKSEQESLMFDVPKATYDDIVQRRTCRPVDGIFRVCGR